MKSTMIFMCEYSNEMMRSIKAIEFKYFTVELEQRHDDIILLQR